MIDANHNSIIMIQTIAEQLKELVSQVVFIGDATVPFYLQNPEAVYSRMTKDLEYLMPSDPKIVGFSNPWYSEGLKEPLQVRLPNKTSINILSAPYFLATKISAFLGREKNDHLVSHDLEDVILVLDGGLDILENIHTLIKSL